MEAVTYHGWRIEPQSRCLPQGGFVGKVRMQHGGRSASATRLLYIRGRWDTEEEALSRAIEAGRRLIDAGLRAAEPTAYAAGTANDGTLAGNEP